MTTLRYLFSTARCIKVGVTWKRDESDPFCAWHQARTTAEVLEVRDGYVSFRWENGESSSLSASTFMFCYTPSKETSKPA